MNGRPRSTRPGEPAPDSARVRHRGSGRLGRVCDAPPVPGAGAVNVLFDGDTRASSVPARNLDYLEGGAASPSEKV